MTRKHNFSAGPSTLPLEVIEQIRADLPEWQSIGASVMEVSHRSKAFSDVLEQTETNIRELLAIPNNYRVLFLHGGASGQFAAVPMNIMADKVSADYCNTGYWSARGAKEAAIYLQANEVFDATKADIQIIPDQSTWQLSDDAAYVHYTSNASIRGIQFQETPNVNNILVADMSSDILSRPIDVEKHGIIYAGAQKNVGVSGVTLVIVRDDLLGKAWDKTPSILNYTVQAEKHSLLNTPCTFAIYVMSLVTAWIKKQGGLKAVETHNRAKAEKVYAAIDANEMYHNPVDPSCRSFANIPFLLPSDELTEKFLKDATEHNLLNLKGHRTVGGIRVSNYNAISMEAIDALTGFMQNFANKA